MHAGNHVRMVKQNQPSYHTENHEKINIQFKPNTLISKSILQNPALSTGPACWCAFAISSVVWSKYRLRIPISACPINL
jgi:hypothetical protein